MTASFDKVYAAVRRAKLGRGEPDDQLVMHEDVICTISHNITHGLHYLYSGCSKPVVHRGLLLHVRSRRDPYPHRR